MLWVLVLNLENDYDGKRSLRLNHRRKRWLHSRIHSSLSPMDVGTSDVEPAIHNNMTLARLIVQYFPYLILERFDLEVGVALLWGPSVVLVLLALVLGLVLVVMGCAAWIARGPG